MKAELEIVKFSSGRTKMQNLFKGNEEEKKVGEDIEGLVGEQDSIEKAEILQEHNVNDDTIEEFTK